MFASVFAATATPALGRGGLQAGQQLGDRLAAGLRLVGLRERIAAAMTGTGRRRHGRFFVDRRRRRRGHRRRWRRHGRRRSAGYAGAGVGVGEFRGMTGAGAPAGLVPVGYRIAGLGGRLLSGGAGMPPPTFCLLLGFSGTRWTVGAVVTRRRVVVPPRDRPRALALSCAGRRPLSLGAGRLPGLRLLRPGVSPQAAASPVAAVVVAARAAAAAARTAVRVAAAVRVAGVTVAGVGPRSAPPRSRAMP